MSSLVALQISLVLLTTTLTGLAVFAYQAHWRKVLALAMFVGLVGIGYAAMISLLGRPKPIAFERFHGQINTKGGGAIVIARTVVEKKAIYIWVKADGASEPIAYKLPWSLETAKQLEKASREAQANGTRIRLREGKEKSSLKSGWVFYAPPPLALPAKSRGGS